MNLIARFEALVIENFKLVQEVKELSQRLIFKSDEVEQVKRERENAREDYEDSERRRQNVLNDLYDVQRDNQGLLNSLREARAAERTAKDEITRLQREMEKANALPASEWIGYADSLVANEVDIKVDSENYVTFSRKIELIKAFRSKTYTGLKEAKDAVEDAARRKYAQSH